MCLLSVFAFSFYLFSGDGSAGVAQDELNTMHLPVFCHCKYVGPLWFYASVSGFSASAFPWVMWFCVGCL